MVIRSFVTLTPGSCWSRTCLVHRVINKDFSSLMSPLAPDIPLIGTRRKGLREAEWQGLGDRAGIRGLHHRCCEALLFMSP